MNRKLPGPMGPPLPGLTSSRVRVRRAGFTLAEASIGLVLAMAGSAMVISLAVTSLTHAAMMDERFLAEEELSNLRERCMAAGAQEITDQWLKKQSLSGPARDKLDLAQLEWKKDYVDPQTGKTVEPGSSAAAGSHWPIRLSATLRWKADKGGRNEVSASWILAPSSMKSEKSGATTGGGA